MGDYDSLVDYCLVLFKAFLTCMSLIPRWGLNLDCHLHREPSFPSNT